MVDSYEIWKQIFDKKCHNVSSNILRNIDSNTWNKVDNNIRDIILNNPAGHINYRIICSYLLNNLKNRTITKLTEINVLKELRSHL